jgi:prolyl 4-hydroxylase
MRHLIRVYDDVLSAEVCKSLIDIFEKNTDSHERYDIGRPSFTQLNFSDIKDQNPDIHQCLVDRGQEYQQRYITETKSSYFPLRVEMEKFRIKRYHNNGIDQFKEHVDVGDYSSARRCLAFFWYLNKVHVGGETIFTSMQRFSVQPKVGRLLIFPPLWMFPHIGSKPISGPKYIVGSYLHYT